MGHILRGHDGDSALKSEKEEAVQDPQGESGVTLPRALNMNEFDPGTALPYAPYLGSPF
jgi:hypothetical protein